MKPSTPDAADEARVDNDQDEAERQRLDYIRRNMNRDGGPPKDPDRPVPTLRLDRAGIVEAKRIVGKQYRGPS